MLLPKPRARACFPSRCQILNGRSWVIVDGAILDVSSFARRHPGGARVIMNALGTDVTSGILGEDASIGNFKMGFAPHSHTDVSAFYYPPPPPRSSAWVCVRLETFSFSPEIDRWVLDTLLTLLLWSWGKGVEGLMRTSCKGMNT